MTAFRGLFASATAERALPAGAAAGQSAPEPPTDIDPREIGGALRRGALWTIASQIVVQAIRIVGVVVLARLLTPSDYGTAALAVTLASFSMLLGDLGYGTALVQATSASRRWVSTACWCALGAGAIGTGVVALGAYPAAEALGEPEVAALVIAGGTTLFLVAAGSTSNALLTRSMRFGAIQGAGMIASALGTSCAVAIAVRGGGAWALVLQQVVLAAVTSGCFIVAARWRPSLEFSSAAMRSLSRFALPYTGASGFWVLQGVVTVLLIGHLVGLAALGIWNLSMAVVIMPIALLAAPVARVMYAAFARLRGEQKRVAQVWLKGFRLLAAIMLPALFGLIAVAPDLIPVVFGSKWAAAVPVIQILCVLVMSRTLQTWNEAVMDAAGKPHVAMAITGAVLIALVPSIWLGSRYGIEGVAVAYCAASLIFGELPSFVMTTRELSLSARTVLRELRGILPASVAACLVVMLGRPALEDLSVSVEPRIVLCVLVGIATYACCLALLAPDVARELRLLARSLIGRFARSGGPSRKG